MAYRYFSFCDDEVAYRLAEDYHSAFEYYNIVVSEYKCIGTRDVGDDCVSEGGTPGACGLL